MSHTSLRDDNAPSLTIEVIEVQLELSEGSGFTLANALGSCLLVPDHNLWTFSVTSVSGRWKQSAGDFWLRHSSEARDGFRGVTGG